MRQLLRVLLPSGVFAIAARSSVLTIILGSRHNMRFLPAMVASCLLASGAWAQDAGRGRALYETHCGTCHYERVHQRLRSDVKDLSDLRDTVARWAPQTKRQYTLDELEEVVQYLNESHYRFGLSERSTPPGLSPR